MSESNLTTFALAAGAAGAGWWLCRRYEQRQQALARASTELVRIASAPDDAPEPVTAAVMTARSPAVTASAPTTSAPAARTTATRGPSQPITREFDSLFAAHGQGLPVPYLRALAAHESDMHAAISDGPAIGLLQVIDAVRDDHNALHGTRYTRADLLTPAVNIEVAAAALRRIIASYARNHPDVANLREDWTNLRFVELLTLGWNAGWSQRAGVGRVAPYLVGRGLPVTVEGVVIHADRAGASPHLSDRRKLAFAVAVAATYARERVRDQAEASQGVASAPVATPATATPAEVAS